MANSLFDFIDSQDREQYFIAIPVLLFFGLLWYWLGGSDSFSSPDLRVAGTSVVAGASATASDLDGDGVSDLRDHCVTKAGTDANFGCPEGGAGKTSGVSASGVVVGAGAAGLGIAGGLSGKVSAPGDSGSLGDRVITVDGTKTSGDAGLAALTIDGVATDADATANADLQAELEARAAQLQETQATLDVRTAELQGMDTDGDSVPDLQDECPTLIGTVGSAGCPLDGDADGIPDAVDWCPVAAGPRESMGCPPDQDRDGVADDADGCPQIAGSGENGCPMDTDGDGVADGDDRCPDEVGTVDLFGCQLAATVDAEAQTPATTDTAAPADAPAAEPAPETDAGNGVVEPSPPALDSDGDGIPDTTDKCPGQRGAEADSGCPPQANLAAADRALLENAISKVDFATNSARLTSESEVVLNTIADLMARYPDTALTISGHTDSGGGAAGNLELSARRARACANYLQERGIGVERLRAFGYGESQPIADNGTREGRRANRRVEFLLSPAE